MDCCQCWLNHLPMFQEQRKAGGQGEKEEVDEGGGDDEEGDEEEGDEGEEDADR